MQILERMNSKDLNNKTGNTHTHTHTHIEVKLRHVHVTIVAVEKHMYYDSVSVALVIYNAMHMRSIILSSVACLALPYS
jgi:hypothetical protein